MIITELTMMYKYKSNTFLLYNGGNNVFIQFLFADVTVQYMEDKKRKTFTRDKAIHSVIPTIN